MQAEDQVLYPLLDDLLGTLSATDVLRRDHRSVTALIDQLGSLRRVLQESSLDRDLVHQLRRTLYGLYLLLTSHFAKEDELYFPLLDVRLDAANTEDLARRMREVTLAAGRLGALVRRRRALRRWPGPCGSGNVSATR